MRPGRPKLKARPCGADTPKDGFRTPVDVPSLAESYRSVQVSADPRLFRRFFSFLGPGFLVSVGYMDPGNWATSIAGGSEFGYTLLSAVLLSSLMAILLQALCARFAIATGRDLAQAAIVSWIKASATSSGSSSDTASSEDAESGWEAFEPSRYRAIALIPSSQLIVYALATS